MPVEGDRLLLDVGVVGGQDDAGLGCTASQMPQDRLGHIAVTGRGVGGEPGSGEEVGYGTEAVIGVDGSLEVAAADIVAALTVDTVAARAGVHRTTVYRRWRDVGGLIADVFAVATDLDWHPPDTGSLRGDLTELNREIQDSLTEEPSIAPALIAVSFRSEDAARALRQRWEDRYTQCEFIVERAIERGEIPAETDARALLVAATAPMYHRLVLLRAPADAGFPERAVAAAMPAARAGAFGSLVEEGNTVETHSGQKT